MITTQTRYNLNPAFGPYSWTNLYYTVLCDENDWMNYQTHSEDQSGCRCCCHSIGTLQYTAYRLQCKGKVLWWSLYRVKLRTVTKVDRSVVFNGRTSNLCAPLLHLHKVSTTLECYSASHCTLFCNTQGICTMSFKCISWMVYCLISIFVIVCGCMFVSMYLKICTSPVLFSM